MDRLTELLLCDSVGSLVYYSIAHVNSQLLLMMAYTSVAQFLCKQWHLYWYTVLRPSVVCRLSSSV